VRRVRWSYARQQPVRSLERTRTPSTAWFTACWFFTIGKDGISELSLKRTLAIGSYQTAWAMLHRLRSVLVRPGRDRLSGRVEVDETYIGGEEAGLPGGRAHGKKVLTDIAVEMLEPKGLGRWRMRPLTDTSAASLHPFVTDFVAPGATIITNAWQAYCGRPGPAGRIPRIICPGAPSRFAGHTVAVGYPPRRGG
jgi:hypothetical protein